MHSKEKWYLAGSGDETAPSFSFFQLRLALLKAFFLNTKANKQMERHHMNITLRYADTDECCEKLMIGFGLNPAEKCQETTV